MRPDQGPLDGAADQPDDDPPSEPISADNGSVEPGSVRVELWNEPADERAEAPPEVAVHLAGIEVALAEMAQRLRLESDRAAARERVIDRQHADIERLRSVERTGQLRPVVTDLCRLRNDLLRQAETVPAEMSGPQVATLLGSFAGIVEDALERCGVAVLPREPGTAFVPGRQQVTGTVEVDDPRLDATVAAVVQDGYAEIDGGKVVAPARVTLHRVTTNETDTDTTTTTTTKEQTDG